MAIQKAERRDGPGRLNPGSGLHLQSNRSYDATVTTDPALPGLTDQPSATVRQQDEFFPAIENHLGVMPWQRPAAFVPVPLETTGVTSQMQQRELLSKSLLYKESIVAKLRSVGAHDIAEPLAECHTQESFVQCTGCKKVRMFWNRCENFYCPSCQPALAKERADSLKWWVNQIEQPKHVVLTTRNTSDLTFSQVKRFKHNLTRLRRSRFARGWRGGMWSLEVTNEGQGWHLHAHLLVDAAWIDERALAIRWGKLVGQDFAIVAVRDARQRDYLKEVTKYTVKGSQLAAWKPHDIVCFINAMQGQRCFGVFGSLYGKRTTWREWIKSLGDTRRVCECGCDKWDFYSADDWAMHQHVLRVISTGPANAPNREPVAPLQPELIATPVAYMR